MRIGTMSGAINGGVTDFNACVFTSDPEELARTQSVLLERL